MLYPNEAQRKTAVAMTPRAERPACRVPPDMSYERARLVPQET
jgi:hypothetical protein